jgi:hypothetical protein
MRHFVSITFGGQAGRAPRRRPPLINYTQPQNGLNIGSARYLRKSIFFKLSPKRATQFSLNFALFEQRFRES